MPKAKKDKTRSNPKISFDATRTERALMHQITRRAEKIARERNNPFDYQWCLIAINACHSNGCPLRLEEFLKADDFNFCHDFFGIINHIDVDTGKLTRCFLPRFFDSEKAGD